MALNVKNIVRNKLTTITEGLDIKKTWERYGHKITQKMFDEDHFEKHQEVFHDHLNQADPTEHKEYAQWIASRYANAGTKTSFNPHTERTETTEVPGINKLEDFGRVHAALSAYHKGKVKKQLATHGVPTDINTVKSLSDLEGHVEKLPSDEKKEATVTKSGDADIHEDEHWKTVIPHTQAGAEAFSECRVGEG